MLHQRTYAFEPSARGAYAIVNAVGELDIAAVGEMRTAVRCAARRASHVVVDLRPATFMDTFALCALVALSEEAVPGDWSLHVVPGAAVQRLLDLSGTRDDLRWISPEQLVG